MPLARFAGKHPMTFRATVTIVILIGAAIALYSGHNDPHRTKLPFATTDLSSVQKALDRLPPTERALVEAYVKRSNGDVLPKQFADPDDPLTARTFAEAIDLQRKWEAKSKVDEARVAKLREEREARMAPLRAAVHASVLKAEILSRNEFQARRDPTFYQRAYRVDKSPAFLVTIRVRNLSEQSIVGLRGSLDAQDAQAYLPMDLCYFDLKEEQSIPSGGFLDLLCGNDYQTASQQQQDFVANDAGRFNVAWKPQYVKFADGHELNTGL
jgi:hypothetical protein